MSRRYRNYDPEPSTSYDHHQRTHRSRSPRSPSRSCRNKLPRLLTDMFEEDECRLCAVEMSSSIIAKMHYGGKPHFKKVKRFMLEWCAKVGMPMVDLEEPQNTLADNDFSDYCEFCNVHFTSLNDKLIHISGKKHKKNEQDPANAKKKQKAYEVVDLSLFSSVDKASDRFVVPSTSSSQSKSYLCDLCGVKAVSYDQLQVHLAGRKHKEKLDKKASTKKSSSKYYCDMCEVGLDTEVLLNLHLGGRTHAKSLKKLSKRGNQGNDCKLTCDFCPFVGNVDEHTCDESLKNLRDDANLEKKHWCPSCVMVFDCNEELEDHKETRRHLITMLNKEKGDKIIEALAPFYCTYCKMQLRSSKEYTDHVFTQKHQERNNLMSNLENKLIFYCSICDLYMDEDAKEDHIGDRKHVKKSVVSVITNHLTEWARNESTLKDFKCDDCNELFNSFLSYSNHMLSDKHVDLVIERYKSEPAM